MEAAAHVPHPPITVATSTSPVVASHAASPPHEAHVHGTPRALGAVLAPVHVVQTAPQHRTPAHASDHHHSCHEDKLFIKKIAQFQFTRESDRKNLK